MNILKKLWCRTFQLGFRIAQPILPYREPKILNAIEEIPEALAKENINSVLLITDGFLRKKKSEAFANGNCYYDEGTEKYNWFLKIVSKKMVSYYDDINDLYVVSDMLITDYSSVFFDYANLSRPIIFYMYDFEEF